MVDYCHSYSGLQLAKCSEKLLAGVAGKKYCRLAEDRWASVDLRGGRVRGQN